MLVGTRFETDFIETFKIANIVYFSNFNQYLKLSIIRIMLAIWNFKLKEYNVGIIINCQFDK